MLQSCQSGFPRAHFAYYRVTPISSVLTHCFLCIIDELDPSLPQVVDFEVVAGYVVSFGGYTVENRTVSLLKLWTLKVLK